MFSLKNLKYWLIAIITCLTAAKGISLLTYHTFKPAITDNLQAYLLFSQGYQHDDFTLRQSYTSNAAALTTDPDLKKVADFYARESALRLKSGVKNTAEANSFEGGLKGISTGVNHPFQMTGLILEESLINPPETISLLNSRYRPLLNQENEAQLKSKIGFWITLFVALFFSWKYRPFLSAPIPRDPANTSSTASLITCPACGSRNRNQTLTTGQKLVCGQCKTVLLSVS